MWLGIDKEIVNSINNNLWIPNMGYYSEYLYGGVYPVQSQAVDNLGQALAIIFGVANPEMARSIISKTPYTPTAYRRYTRSNPTSSPTTTTPCGLSFRLTGTLRQPRPGTWRRWKKVLRLYSVRRHCSAPTRSFSLPITATSRGTVVNSDSQLWSCTGMAAMIYRVIMGMDFKPDGISFAPVVPRHSREKRRSPDSATVTPT